MHEIFSIECVLYASFLITPIRLSKYKSKMCPSRWFRSPSLGRPLIFSSKAISFGVKSLIDRLVCLGQRRIKFALIYGHFYCWYRTCGRWARDMNASRGRNRSYIALKSKLIMVMDGAWTNGKVNRPLWIAEWRSHRGFIMQFSTTGSCKIALKLPMESD